MKKKGVKNYDTSNRSRSFCTFDLCWGNRFRTGRAHSCEKGYQIDKQKLILCFAVAAVVLFIAAATDASMSPCHQQDFGVYCDLNNQTYATYSACYDACYATFDGSDIKLHVSRSVIELFYLLTGALLGVIFIISIIVGLR